VPGLLHPNAAAIGPLNTCTIHQEIWSWTGIYLTEAGKREKMAEDLKANAIF
jgi:hypothetical protein